MRALLLGEQRHAVGDGDLVVVGMDLGEGEEAVAVAAIFDEGGLQRRLDPRHLGEIDVSAQLLAVGSLEIEFLDAVAADDDDPGLFRVGGVDEHLVGHANLSGRRRSREGNRSRAAVIAGMRIPRERVPASLV